MLSKSEESHCQEAEKSILGRKAIFVVGSASSGKTTLCDAFAAHNRIPPSKYIKEVARNVMKEHNFTRADVGTYEMQAAIMMAQLRAEVKVRTETSADAPTDNQNILLLSDRSAVDPMVYAITSGTQEIQTRLRHSPEFESVLPLYRQSLFVLLSPVTEWIKDDGVRSLQDPWKYDNSLRCMLDELDIPYHEISQTDQDINTRVQLLQKWASN